MPNDMVTVRVFFKDGGRLRPVSSTRVHRSEVAATKRHYREGAYGGPNYVIKVMKS